jgi:hypothetical protein
MTVSPIRPRERDAIVQSLRAGVVPRSGQQHIQVGRVEEVKALIADVERIADGGSAIRFVIGDFGSGKTFFLNLIRSIALEKKLVTVATGGQARALYQELVRNMSTRSKPDGGALASVVERFVTTSVEAGRERNIKPEVVIRERLASLSEMVNGYDFAEVIACYWKGHDTGNDTLKSDAIRWLRGEFSANRCARSAWRSHHRRRLECLRPAQTLGSIRSTVGIYRAGRLLRRVGQSLQVGEHESAKHELRTDPAHLE